MATPNFTKGITSLDFTEGQHASDGIEQVFNDNVYYSIGGVAMVEKWGDIKDIFEFTTGKMSLAERDALMSFVVTDIEGRKESFTFSDRDGNSHTVRLVEDKVHYVVDGPAYWIAKLTLEKLVT